MNKDRIKEILGSIDLNTHQTLWDESTKLDEDDKQRLILSAAILGHYRAFSASDEGDQVTLKAIARINQEWQTLKQISYKTNNSETHDKFCKAIIDKNKELIEMTLENGLPSFDDAKRIMKIDDIPVSRFRRLWHFIKNKLLFLSQLGFGSNNFLSMTFERRKQFSEVLDHAEKGKARSGISVEDIAASVQNMPGSHSTPLDKSNYHLKFSEYHVENPKTKQILEMMKISKETNLGPNHKKNIIIYVGGRTDNYASNIKGILNQFWALDSVDQFWHINPRYVSLAASETAANYDDVTDDIDEMYKAILEKEPNANITLYAMCAGSPAACEVAKKYNLKFYSDRSFVSANDFIDIQFNQNNWYLKALMLILTPIKVIRKLFFSSMRYSINQGSTYSDLPRHSSDLHVVMPPKSSQGSHDLVTLGSHVSLHKSKAIVESDRKFDDAFIQVCQTLLEEYKIDLRKKRPWLDKVKKSDSIDDHHKKLLENILMWHKDRKSYIPKESSVKINPHLAFPSMLTARFSTDQHNPLWRLNIFSSYSSNEGNDLVEAIKNEHLKTLAELACPIATKFSQDMKNLDCEMKNHELKKDLSIGEDSDHDVDNDPLLSGDGGHPRRRRTNHRRRT